jgi:hypothetical protein
MVNLESTILLTAVAEGTEFDHAELNELKSKFRECEQSLHYLQGLIDDSSEIELFDKSSYKYTTETIMCVCTSLFFSAW